MKPSTDSRASSAMPAGMRNWWRSAANAGALSPSCGARRMAETAAHLVEHVLPEQPIRQWVLSFPYPLRFLFATRPAVLSQVLGIVYRAISTFLIRRAGLRVGAGARTGAVTLIQRFTSALNLNNHLHLLVLDGAYTFTAGRARFHRARVPTNDEIERLLDVLIRRIVRTLTRAQALVAGPEEEGAQPYLHSNGPMMRRSQRSRARQCATVSRLARLLGARRYACRSQAPPVSRCRRPRHLRRPATASR